MILDEPTSGLDPAGEETMTRLLNRLNRQQGITLILATCLVDMLPLFAYRIYLMNKGRVLSQGLADEVFGDHEMLDKAGLRVPYISTLLHEMKRYEGVPINGLPLTVGEARNRFIELIPEELIVKRVERM